MKKSLFSLFAAVAVVAPLSAQEATYTVDSVHSVAFVKALHFGAGMNYVRFNKVTGTVVFNEADAAKSSVSIEIPAESVDSANEKRDQHLKGPDFLNAKQFPTITFKSTKVAKKDDKTYTVTGDLTVRGTTKSVTTEFRVSGFGKGPDGAARAGGEANFKVKRSDFGVTYGPGALSDEVEIILAVEGVKK